MEQEVHYSESTSVPVSSIAFTVSSMVENELGILFPSIIIVYIVSNKTGLQLYGFGKVLVYDVMQVSLQFRNSCFLFSREDWSRLIMH